MIHQSPPAARRARGSLLRGGGADWQDRLVPPLLLGAQRGGPAQHSPALPHSPGNRHDGPVRALGGASVRAPIFLWDHETSASTVGTRQSVRQTRTVKPTNFVSVRDKVYRYELTIRYETKCKHFHCVSGSVCPTRPQQPRDGEGAGLPHLLPCPGCVGRIRFGQLPLLKV